MQGEATHVHRGQCGTGRPPGWRLPAQPCSAPCCPQRGRPPPAGVRQPDGRLQSTFVKPHRLRPSHYQMRGRVAMAAAAELDGEKRGVWQLPHLVELDQACVSQAIPLRPVVPGRHGGLQHTGTHSAASLHAAARLPPAAGRRGSLRLAPLPWPVALQLERPPSSSEDVDCSRRVEKGPRPGV